MSEQSPQAEALQTRIADLEVEVAELRGRLAQEAPLSAREALLLEAERAAHLGSWMWDLRTQQVSWSDELYRMLGLDSKTVTATVEGFYAKVHPDDVVRVTATTQRSIANRVAELVELRFLRDDGDVREIIMDGAFIEEDGELVRAVGTCLDVTEWRSAEREAQRSRALLELTERVAGVGVFFWEPGEGRTDWSAEMYRIFGGEETLDCARFVEVALEEDRDVVRAMQAQVQARGEAGPVSFRIRRPDNSVRHLLMSARVTGDAGSVGGTVVDITERIELEEQLRQSQKIEAIGRLAGGVAHDFNNLLTAILGNAEVWLADNPASAEAQEVMEAAEQAGALTKQLLTFSRQTPLDRRIHDLNEVAASAQTLIRRVIGDDVEVAFETGSEHCTVVADANQLVQILLNLALNSRDAMPSGGQIRISTCNVQLEPGRRPAGAVSGRFVELRVSDDGAGMSDKTRDRIFEPFFTTKGPGEGTGLGLSTVLGIVSQHGGCIEVDSAAGKGSEFRVYLPRRDGAPEPLMERPQSSGDARPGRHFDARVLLVEDEAQVRKAVRSMLERAGYSVVDASRPSEALAVVDASVGLLITDLVMPEGGGLDLARRLRAERPQLGVLYMTGHAPDDSREADAPVLRKPFTSRQLLEAVREVLEA